MPESLQSSIVPSVNSVKGYAGLSHDSLHSGKCVPESLPPCEAVGSLETNITSLSPMESLAYSRFQQALTSESGLTLYIQHTKLNVCGEMMSSQSHSDKYRNYQTCDSLLGHLS